MTVTELATVSPRTSALSDLLQEPFSSPKAPLDEGWLDAVAMLLVDAIADRDSATIGTAVTMLPRLQRVSQGPTGTAAFALSAVARLAEERCGLGAVHGLEADSHPARMLCVIVRSPGLSNDEISAALSTDSTEVSRSGARLRSDGLAFARKLGRRNAWEATPRGVGVARELLGASAELAQAIEPTSQASLAEAFQRSADLLLTVVESLRAAESVQTGSPLKSALTDTFEMLFRPIGGALTSGIKQVRAVIDGSAAQGAAVADPTDGEWLLRLHVSPPAGGPPCSHPPDAKALEVKAHPKGWAVIWPNGKRAIRVFARQQQAVMYAKKVARKRGVELKVGADSPPPSSVDDRRVAPSKTPVSSGVS